MVVRPDTDRETVRAIRSAVDSGRTLIVELLNYRKDGTKFWNRLTLVPIHRTATATATEAAAAVGAAAAAAADSDAGGGAGGVARQRTAVAEYLGVQQELPTVDPVSGTAEQAAAAAQSMIEPIGFIGTQMAVESEHRELMDLMSMLGSRSFSTTDDDHGAGSDGGSGGGGGGGGGAGTSRYLRDQQGQLDLDSAAFGFCNPNLPGAPLTHASAGFLKLTGYTLAEAIGQDVTELLQGPQTSPSDFHGLGLSTRVLEGEGGGEGGGSGESARAARALGGAGTGGYGMPPVFQKVTRKMRCQKKGGDIWWNMLHLSPLQDHTGHTALVVVCLADISHDHIDVDSIDVDALAPDVAAPPLGRVKSEDHELQRGPCANGAAAAAAAAGGGGGGGAAGGRTMYSGGGSFDTAMDGRVDSELEHVASALQEHWLTAKQQKEQGQEPAGPRLSD